MALENNTNSRFNDFSQVFEDFAEWFSHLSMAVSYPKEDVKVDKIKIPQTFQSWLEENATSDNINKEAANDVAHVYADMISKGKEVALTLQSGTKPEFDDFNELKSLYTGFLMKLSAFKMVQSPAALTWI